MSWDEITVLVDKAKLGDRAAFGELVVRFQDTVHALAMAKVRNHAEAQDLAQDVFAHAMRKLPQLRDARCFAGWLRRIVGRMAINRLTRRGPAFGADPEVLSAVPGTVAEAGDLYDRADEAATLREAVTRLKASDRATLEAFYLRGQSLKDMAREFDAPVGTIKRRLFVARDRLRDVLIEAGFTDFDLPPVAAKGRELAGV